MALPPLPAAVNAMLAAPLLGMAAPMVGAPGTVIGEAMVTLNVMSAPTVSSNWKVSMVAVPPLCVYLAT